MAEDGARPPDVKAGPIIGVEVGIKTLATGSDGTTEENLRALAACRRRLRRVQNQLARQVKGSRRRDRTKPRLARLPRRVGNLRYDVHPKATSAMAKHAGPVGD